MKNRISLLAVFIICLLSTKYVAAQDITCTPTASYVIMPNNITVLSGYEVADADPCRIMDGDTGTRWKGNNSNSTGEYLPFIIEFDLGVEKHLDQLDIAWRKTDRHYLFSIEVLGDDGSFSPIEMAVGSGIPSGAYTKSEIPSDPLQILHSFTLKYRYKTTKIRYIAYGAEFASGSYNQQNEIREIQILDTNTSPEPGPSGGDSPWLSNADDIFFNSGNVGIGRTPSNLWSLDVGGNIRAEEIKVEISSGQGPDYVFLENYTLKSLEEVQAHIDTYGHLPNIPSAKEMETNGIELGDLNMKLLEKIEELTLYILEQERRISDLEGKSK